MPRMIDRPSFGRFAATLAAALLLSKPGGPRAAAADDRPCCYTNPQYSGQCAVQPARGETCASILAYLNNPSSQGKSYCNSTNIRGGWKLLKCARSNTTEPSAKP
jgi:hypothetical protein